MFALQKLFISETQIAFKSKAHTPSPALFKYCEAFRGFAVTFSFCAVFESPKT